MIKFHRHYRRQGASACRRDYVTPFEQMMERYRLGEPKDIEFRNLGLRYVPSRAKVGAQSAPSILEVDFPLHRLEGY